MEGTKTSGLSLEMYEAGTAFKIHKVKASNDRAV
jgi:hypothetical protein